LFHSSKGVLPSVLLRLRNLQCETTKVLTRTVESHDDDDDDDDDFCLRIEYVRTLVQGVRKCFFPI
jgi:hypothetical protein